MFALVRELLERFIELFSPKGGVYPLGSYHKKMFSSLLVYASAVTWIAVGLGFSVLHQRQEREEWEETSAVIQQIFSVEDNPLISFVSINRELTARLETIQNEHIRSLEERESLARDNERLVQENLYLHELVKARQCLKDN